MILPSLRLRFDVFFLVVRMNSVYQRRIREVAFKVFKLEDVANMMKMSHTGKWMNWVFERMTSLKHTTEDQMAETPRHRIKFREIQDASMNAMNEVESIFSDYELEIKNLRAEVKKLKADIKCFWVEGNNDLKQKYEETN